MLDSCLGEGTCSGWGKVLFDTMYINGSTEVLISRDFSCAISFAKIFLTVFGEIIEILYCGTVTEERER